MMMMMTTFEDIDKDAAGMIYSSNDENDECQ